jgi:2,4-dienoyl-CoA reductase-like NADH-dependent reductase (Old Yellow Enzyme family)
MRANSIAFQPGKIGSVNVKNRLVRSATFECMASENGEVTQMQGDLYRKLAIGGIGLIITSHSAVHPRGYSHPKQIRIFDDKYIPGVRQIAHAVHECNNDCKIFMQLTHAGRQQARPELGFPAVAPSPVFDELFQRIPKELTQGEIHEIVQYFADGVSRAREAEFDGVQLHAAHGWLLSSFLSPHTNKRKDMYGGSTRNRIRIMEEIYESAIEKVGDDFPILVKMNSQDFLPDGVNPEEAKEIAKHLSRIGFAAIEISGGMWESMTRSEEELGWKPVPIPEARIGIKGKKQEAYFWSNAREIGKQLDITLILVGGIRSIDKIEEILEEGTIDFCAMARPLIREPDLPNRWLRGQGKDAASCISCNRCLPRGNAHVECRADQKSISSADLLPELFPYFRERSSK